MKTQGAPLITEPLTLSVEDFTLSVMHHVVNAAKAVLIIVPGRPQTKVGPHRLFIEIANHMNQIGVATFRFDHRGWGDSTGQRLSYEESWQDLEAVMALVEKEYPDKPVFVLGLCDGATAALLALSHLTKVNGLILLNLFLESPAAESEAMLKQHYLPRLLSPANWLKQLAKPKELPGKLWEFIPHLAKGKGQGALPAPKQALNNLATYSHSHSLLLFSDDDLTAKQAQLQLNRHWETAPPHVASSVLTGADHTFSKPGNKPQLLQKIGDFINANSIENNRRADD